MATTVSMPQLGETVTEGTILRWAKQVGDTVAADEVLVEISTDKVDTEVPSPAAGTILEILVPEGETVAVGTATGGDRGGRGAGGVAEGRREAAAAEPAAEEEAPAGPTESTGGGAQTADSRRPQKQPAEAARRRGSGGGGAGCGGAGRRGTGRPSHPPQRTADGGRPTAATAVPAPAQEPVGGNGEGEGDGARRVLSPVVRRLAREHGLDLSGVAGTGQGGRITRQDVEALLGSGAGRRVPRQRRRSPRRRAGGSARQHRSRRRRRPVRHRLRAPRPKCPAVPATGSRTWTGCVPGSART